MQGSDLTLLIALGDCVYPRMAMTGSPIRPKALDVDSYDGIGRWTLNPNDASFRASEWSTVSRQTKGPLARRDLFCIEDVCRFQKRDIDLSSDQSVHEKNGRGSAFCDIDIHRKQCPFFASSNASSANDNSWNGHLKGQGECYCYPDRV